MSIDGMLSSRGKSSAFSPFRVANPEKMIPFSSGICTAPTFGCLQSAQHSFSHQYLYPTLINAGFQRYFGQEHGIVPLVDPAKGVVPHLGPYLHHAAPIPGFGYHAIEDKKPSQSYIGLIGKAILSTPQKKLVLSDIYNYIITNYPYFRNKRPGWRNSIRHNLSLNECFIKVGRSPNGKGHFWAINPSNYEDFSKGEYRRKRASKKRSTGDNIKLKSTVKEKQIMPKPEPKHEYTKSVASSTGTFISGMYGRYSVTYLPNKITVIKENKGFHIETLLSGLRNDNDSHSSLIMFEKKGVRNELENSLLTVEKGFDVKNSGKIV